MRRIPHLSLIVSLCLFVIACAGRPSSTKGRVYYPADQVYVVASSPGVFYYPGTTAGGSHYRVHSDRGEEGRSVVGPWRPVKRHRLPPGLRKKWQRVR